MTNKRARELELRRERLIAANTLIEAIATHGRRFFSLRADCPDWTGQDRISRLLMDRYGRIWFIDKYRESLILMSHTGNWKGFSEGGTLAALVMALYRYIMTGEPLHGSVGPWPAWYSDGDPWGYGDDMQAVRDVAINLGLLDHEHGVLVEAARVGSLLGASDSERCRELGSILGEACALGCPDKASELSLLSLVNYGKDMLGETNGQR